MDKNEANPVFSVTKSVMSALTGIAIKDVLTMTGGLESIDSDCYSCFTSPDLLEYVLQKPLSYKPGDTFDYNTGLTHCLSTIITDTSLKILFHDILKTCIADRVVRNNFAVVNNAESTKRIGKILCFTGIR